MERNSRLNRWKFYVNFIVIGFISLTLNAAEQNSNELELLAIANLDNAALENDQWQTILPVLGDENQYFIATQAGKIYQLHESEMSSDAFFDLQTALPNADIIALNAITLDPNFHYRDREGYQTFYTAHTEVSNNAKTRITPKNPDTSPAYDTVVMRWKINGLQHLTPQVNLQYEIMRIAIVQPHEHIQQLSFNPYIEHWHDDFGLLFIALARNEALQNEALYAGSILRIKPEKYGFKNYTVPVNNPFTKVVDIPNEIIFIAGQTTEHFDWMKQSTYSLLVHFNEPDANLLIQAKIGDDWRKTIPKEQIKKRLPSLDSKQKTLFYQGRELKKLWGKMLHLQEQESDWQLQALSLSANNDDSNNTQNISHKLINPSDSEQVKFSLHQKLNGELLLLEHNQQRLYAINKPQASINESTIVEDIPLSAGKNYTWIFSAFLLLMLMSCFLYIRHVRVKKRGFFQQQWANFKVDKNTQSISLYKRHSKAAEKHLKISSLMRSEIVLNDEVISTISADESYAFSNDVEALVLATFGNENRIKMINDKQRKIQLCLTDNNKKQHTICLYFRIGNIRHTKLKYQQVIDQAIDWQWLFAQYINPSNTSKRKIKVKLAPKENLVATAAKNKVPVIHDEHEDHSTEATQYADPFIEEATKSQHLEQNNAERTVSTADFDNTIVAALDKLATMKKQGYLSEAEFNTAKAKLLKNLVNE